MVNTVEKERREKKRVKTPTVLQMEAVECGAASLGILMGYYGRHTPLEELRVACGVSRDGSKASNMVKAARNYGMEAKGYRKNIDQLKELTMPVIIHWNFNHFLVLEGFYKDKVYLNDPAKGPRTVSEEEFEGSFTGIVLDIKPGPDFEKSDYRPSLLRSLKKRVTGLKEALLFVFVLGFFLVIPGIITPTFTRIFIDDILLAGKVDWLLPLLLGMTITLVAQTLLVWFRQKYLLQLQTRLSIGNSGKYMWHVLRLPSSFYYQRMAGDISNRVQINDRVAMLISGQLATAFLDILIAGFFLLLMIQYNLLLTGISLLFALLNIIFLQYMSRKRKDDSLLLLQEKGKLLSTSMFGLQMIETLKATGQESDFFSRWAGYQANALNKQQDLERSSQILMAVPQLLTSTAMALVLITGGYLVMDGLLTIGMLVAFQGLMMNFMEPIKRVVNLGAQLQEVDSDLKRLDDVENHPLDQKFKKSHEEPQDLTEQRAKLSGYIQLKDVVFGYSRLEEPLIEEFNLSLNPGSRVALVGSSGSGKSTIAKLVAGLYEPWGGEIFFDGIRRDEIPLPIIHSSIAVVDQDISMLEGSVRENLTLWNESIPQLHLSQAAKDALIDESISRKKGGYDGAVEEGGRNFSGGERQRLEIARTLTGNPTVLILDEATSALDPITEKKIDENIRRRGCTCIIVAHRLSTIRDCDEIIVMDKGRVVQRGTHEELVSEEDGMYRELISNE